MSFLAKKKVTTEHGVNNCNGEQNTVTSQTQSDKDMCFHEV